MAIEEDAFTNHGLAMEGKIVGMEMMRAMPCVVCFLPKVYRVCCEELWSKEFFDLLLSRPSVEAYHLR